MKVEMQHTDLRCQKHWRRDLLEVDEWHMDLQVENVVVRFAFPIVHTRPVPANCNPNGSL